MRGMRDAISNKTLSAFVDAFYHQQSQQGRSDSTGKEV
jgi:queuine/archaeosine tRNA-ribosyltransferase